ncbi:MAG: hypothetical protein ACYS8Z_07205 [Planctomycetota bacterium]|jgi:uncharacterized membrane protein
MSNDQTEPPVVSEACHRLGRKLVRKGRRRSVYAVILLLLGGYLLYTGLSEQEHVSTAFGIVFVLYAMFVRFHIRKVKTIKRQLEAEIAQLKEGRSGDESPELEVHKFPEDPNQ